MTRRLAGILVIGVLASFSVSVAAAPKVERKVGPELIYLDHADTTPGALRDMPLIPPQAGEREAHDLGLLPHHHALPVLGSQRDAARQTTLGPLVAATAGLSFDGVGVPNYKVNSVPPDTNGAAGATQYVQWVNTAFAVFSKSTGAIVYGPAAGSSLWQGFGGRCETDNNGDPVVMYDKAAGRWVMTQFAVSASPFYQCIAVSTSSDATGAWRRFAYQFPDFNDYPKGGVWPDAYYVTYNMFNSSGTAFLGSKVCAYDRNQMLTASGLPGPQQCFQLSSAYGGLLPSDLDGSIAPPAGSPNFMLAFDDAGLNGLNLWKFHVDWASPASSTLTGPVKIPTASFTEACNGGTCIPQGGNKEKLDSLADRLMHRLAYRRFADGHEALVVNHSVSVGSTPSGVRWYELRNPAGGTIASGTPVVYQQGTYSPNSISRWMGSIAMDKAGNIALGYSASSASINPSIRYTGRAPGDALGTLQAEATIINGGGSQKKYVLPGGRDAGTRWGDYSAMTIDPADDCTFWYTTEYLKTSGTFNWSTRIASFKFSTCQ